MAVRGGGQDGAGGLSMMVLPGYRDVELVGEGGLGRVYRAVRESTGGVVAVKELRDIAQASPAWSRARRELDAMLRLKGHPYVVSVEEIVQGPAGPCLVMEFLPGGSLMDRLAGGVLSGPEVVLVGQQVSQALAAAHQVGMVHRDVKPHNLLVGQFGQVKVCDFGIAALARGAGLQTQTQALTLAYASPEALDGDGSVGPAADVYSFGATMVHLMTGRKPSMQERLGGARLELTSVADPSLVSVAAVLNACLSYRPEDRPSMAVVSATFDQAAIDLGPRRLAALPLDHGADADQTRVRPAAATATLGTTNPGPVPGPSPVPEAPTIRAASVAQTPPHAAPPAAQYGPVVAAPMPGQYASAPVAAPVGPRRGLSGLWILATGIAMALIVAGAVVVTRSEGPSDPVPVAALDTGVQTTAPAVAPTPEAASTTTVAPAVETAAPTVPPTTAALVPPASVRAGPPTVTQVLASVVRSPSTDACGNPTQYQPTNAIDRRLDTAWMAPGNGVGASLTFQLAQLSTVSTVGLVPGYDKFDPCTQTDRFFELRRVTAVRWTFDDGSSFDQELVPEPRMQYLQLPRPVVTTRVTMTVLGTLEPGIERLDHTPVSEAEIL